MRYWNVTAAATDLASGQISEWGKAKYLIAGSIFSIMAMAVPLWMFKYTITTTTMVGYVISLFIVIGGFIRLFKMNANIDANNFIERYVIFAFPTAIKVTTLFWLVSFAFIISLTALGYANSPLWQYFGLLSTPLYYVAFFWVMGHGFNAYNA